MSRGARGPSSPTVRHSCVSPFPAKLPNGQIVDDEFCRCGHLRSKHFDSASFGHGKCGVEGCQCSKFSWESRILSSKKASAEP